MFRQEEQKEQKEEGTLIWRSKLQVEFQHVAVFADGSYLVGTERDSSGVSIINIWDIKRDVLFFQQEFDFRIKAIILLKNELIIACNDRKIRRFIIDMHNKIIERHLRSAPIKIEVCCMTLLSNEQLAIGSIGGVIGIYDLNTKALTHYGVGLTKITAIDTQRDGLLVASNEDGNIIIFNPESERYTTHKIDMTHIKGVGQLPDNTIIVSLVVLPDNTIITVDSDENLQHWAIIKNQVKQLYHSQLEGDCGDLVSMPNGWIGCSTGMYFELFEPSCIRDYVNTQKNTDILNQYLPPPITDIVIGYSTVATLFNPPKMPNNKEYVLENQTVPSPRAWG